MKFDDPIVFSACRGEQRDVFAALMRRLGKGSGGGHAALYCNRYEDLASRLEEESAERLSRAVCVVDLSLEPPQHWDLVQDNHPMRPTWLAWRFPEVYWVFVVMTQDEIPLGVPPLTATMHFVTVRHAAKHSELLRRHAGGLRAWFDPWELRRSAMPPSPHGQGAGGPVSPPGLLLSTQLGIVLDEETAYAAFNGYLLYRRGMAACIVATAREFDALADRLCTEPRALSVLEDVELNFADASADTLFMPERASDVLRTVTRRDARLGFDVRPPAARVYVSASLVPGMPTVLKPFAGLYDPVILSLVGASGWRRAPLVKGHSAPGACQAIAAALIARARATGREAADTLTGLHCALLTLEAERLLADSTYAMTMECLAMRQGFEALAECSFSGATDELTVAPRLEELEGQIRRLVFHCDTEAEIQRRMQPGALDYIAEVEKFPKRQLQYAYAMLEVLGRLREVYGQERKMEEEEHVLQQIRLWRVRLFRRKRSLSSAVAARLPAGMPAATRYNVQRYCRSVENLWRHVISLPLAYVIHVLRPAWLFTFIVLWIGAFATVYALLASQYSWPGVGGDWAAWLRHSAVTFLAMQQGTLGDPAVAGMPEDTKFSAAGHAAFWYCTLLEMGFGYFHLGLLVAVLVQKITRR